MVRLHHHHLHNPAIKGDEELAFLPCDGWGADWRALHPGAECTCGVGRSDGHNVKLQNNVSVYTGVELEDEVFYGPSCVFTNVLNPRAQIVRHHQYARAVVRRGATIGRCAFVGVGQWCEGTCRTTPS